MIRGALSPELPADESAKLRKIVAVLMEQVERGIDLEGNAYSLFQTAVVLEDKVRERTQRLEGARRALERRNNDLRIAKEQTETAQTRLMEAVETISEGFIYFDRDDRLVLCNSRFIELWSGPRDIREVIRPGVAFRQISRWTVESGLVADAAEAPEDWLAARLDCHARPAQPIIVRLTNNRWVQIRERQTRDGGTVGIYTDVTEIKLGEQRRRERELAEKTMLLQWTLDSLVQGVSVFDADLRLVAWNARFVELLDLPDWLVRQGAAYGDYLRYRAARGDFEGDSEAAVAGRLEQVRRLERAKREQRLPTGVILEARRDPMPGGGFVTTYTDITARHQAAAQLREANENLERRVAARTSALTALNAKLQQEIFERAAVEEALRLAKAQAETANMSKTRFLAAASHDLLQPLNAARLFATALAERPLAGKDREYVGHIDRALSSVETLLGTLLDISKMDAGAVVAERTNFVIGDLLQALAEEYAPVARGAGLALACVSSSAVVHTDPALLSRVLRNFLGNAVRYTASGRILLGCRRLGDRVRIEVHDTGRGIPEASQSEIFEEFRQLQPGRRCSGKSFGLGLAIVKRICRVLGHRVSVRSRVGCGSVFSVDVPIGTMPHALPSWGHDGAAMAVNRVSGALLLVIDDEESILAGMGELLGGWGCAVVTAQDCDGALRQLAERRQRPDVIIADYHLAEQVTGIDAVDAVRKKYGAGVPALLVTADHGSGVQEIARARGIRVLRKPLKPGKLRALLSHLLDGRQDAAGERPAAG